MQLRKAELDEFDIKKVIVVIPFFNEAGNLKVLLRGLEGQKDIIHSVFFVNDGSTDSSENIIYEEGSNIGIPIKLLRLSRNFGHQKAILAGLESAFNSYREEAYYAVMDSDNEDKPEDLRLLLDLLHRLNCSCVFAVRKSRQTSWFDSLASNTFHKMFRWLSTDFEVPSSGAFCLMLPKVVREILRFQVYQPYFPGMRAWVGFKQQAVELARGKREFNASRVKLGGRIRLAFTSFLNHTNMALGLILWGGLSILGISLLASAILSLLRILGIIKISGFTSVLVSIFISTGLILMALSIMTHYIARIYYTISAYPRVVVDDLVEIKKNSDDNPANN